MTDPRGPVRDGGAVPGLTGAGGGMPDPLAVAVSPVQFRPDQIYPDPTFVTEPPPRQPQTYPPVMPSNQAAPLPVSFPVRPAAVAPAPARPALPPPPARRQPAPPLPLARKRSTSPSITPVVAAVVFGALLLMICCSALAPSL